LRRCLPAPQRSCTAPHAHCLRLATLLYAGVVVGFDLRDGAHRRRYHRCCWRQQFTIGSSSVRCAVWMVPRSATRRSFRLFLRYTIHTRCVSSSLFVRACSPTTPFGSAGLRFPALLHRLRVAPLPRPAPLQRCTLAPRAGCAAPALRYSCGGVCSGTILNVRTTPFLRLVWTLFLVLRLCRFGGRVGT
jgi:hypothetical protein